MGGVPELPRARTEGVITEPVDGELVVYDKVNHTAHCLAPGAASVWERCDGLASPAEIAQALGVPAATVDQALTELRDCGLLDEPPALPDAYSRRQAVARIAKVGGVAFTAPLIYSVVVVGPLQGRRVRMPNAALAPVTTNPRARRAYRPRAGSPARFAFPERRAARAYALYRFVTRRARRVCGLLRVQVCDDGEHAPVVIR